MPRPCPQNPSYKVDASLLQACCPKVLCVHCNTVIGVQVRRAGMMLRCPACCAALTLQCDGTQWRTVPAAEPDPIPAPENGPSTP